MWENQAYASDAHLARANVDRAKVHVGGVDSPVSTTERYRDADVVVHAAQQTDCMRAIQWVIQEYLRYAYMPSFGLSNAT